MNRPVREIQAPFSPLEAIARWPVDQPLVALHSGRLHKRWARWSILASPRETWRLDGLDRDLRGEAGDDPAAQLESVLASTRSSAGGAGELPFVGGWIGGLSYDLGPVLEPAAQGTRSAADDRGWPIIELAYCPGAIVFDHLAEQWFVVGEPVVAPDDLCDAARVETPIVGDLTPDLAPDDYLAMVNRTIEYIAAGDVFQANITQRWRATFTGSTRALAARALADSQAWYGAYMEMADGRCAISLSPELFLEVKDRDVVTRPIKGTRPASASVRELLESSKDQAELHMIVDLMRNDLGRVCEFGSVTVPCARRIETHPTVHHGVGEVRGVLRDDVSVGELIRATFPGGSVTGAPKIRAMQIIDELEPMRRGLYCGSIGMFSDCGRVCLNIAIRTMLLSGEREPGRFDQLRGTLDYAAGGGIVADSDPGLEYRESLDKTAVARAVLSSGVVV